MFLIEVGLEFLAASEASFTLAPALLIALGRTNSFIFRGIHV
jgi:hypothetical protein